MQHHNASITTRKRKAKCAAVERMTTILELQQKWSASEYWNGQQIKHLGGGGGAEVGLGLNKVYLRKTSPLIFITKTCLFKYSEILPPKNENF